MLTLTGIEGHYDPGLGMYQPPNPYRTWGAVVEDGMRDHRLRLWNPSAMWREIDDSPF